MALDRCTLCDHPVWPGQKLVRTHDGKAHKKCQRQYVREASEPSADFMRLTAAAQLKGITLEAMRQIVRRADLPAFCELCLEWLPVESLRHSHPKQHKCPNATGQARAHVVLRRADVEEYEVSAASQTSGRLGGLATQKARDS